MVKVKSNEVIQAQHVILEDMLYKTVNIFMGIWAVYYVTFEGFHF
jgi:hypothetical protein